jgi:hypothetical protein
MALEIIDGRAAWRNLVTNKYAYYPTAENKERLKPYASPETTPGFRIATDSKVFTIGSCFAREVDKALIKGGINVVSRIGLSENVQALLGGRDSIFNKYTIHSMMNEIRWALDPATPFPGDRAFVQQDDQFGDLQLGGKLRFSDLSTTDDVRRSFTSAMKNAAQADVFIATLGLAECWYDNELGLYLNAAPTLQVCQAYPGRFDFRVLDHQEIYSGIADLCGIVRKFGKPSVKFLLTVSPVALHATFREQDVLVANSYSKSVQRAALEQYVLEHDDTDYFPSYETVTLSQSPAYVAKDFRHVRPYVVRRIMGAVLCDYLGQASPIHTDSELVHQLYKEGNFGEIVSLVSNIDIASLDLKAARQVAVSYQREGNWVASYGCYRDLVTRYPTIEALHKRLIRAAKNSGSPELSMHILEYKTRFQRNNVLDGNRSKPKNGLRNPTPWISAAVAAATTGAATNFSHLQALWKVFFQGY